MTIVGLTGSIGSGKTTFADFLSGHDKSAAHWESWQLIAEVANALRRSSTTHPAPTDLAAINTWLEPLLAILKRVCHKVASFEAIELTEAGLASAPQNYDKLLEYLAAMQAKPALQKLTITEDNKETFRNILQWLGGYLVKTVGAGIWYDEIIRRIQASDGLVLATVSGVRFPGDARRIKLAGGSILEIQRPDIAIKDLQDLTERERSLIKPDAIIQNDGSLEQLERCASQVRKDSLNMRLAADYQASSF